MAPAKRQLDGHLAGKCLIAMPRMGDPRFIRSVVYLCAHSAEGAMGLIVNKPAADVRLDELLEHLGIPHGPGVPGIRVHIGGPVEHARGFVLHSSDYESPRGTMKVDDAISMTATTDVLEQIAAGTGPRESLLALGYAGWGPGQLETEIAQNGWLTAEARSDLVFGHDDDSKWTAALRWIGVDPVTLSSQIGHA
jgi:putative transcriptional regulator